MEFEHWKCIDEVCDAAKVGHLGGIFYNKEIPDILYTLQIGQRSRHQTAFLGFRDFFIPFFFRTYPPCTSIGAGFSLGWMA